MANPKGMLQCGQLINQPYRLGQTIDRNIYQLDFVEIYLDILYILDVFGYIHKLEDMRNVGPLSLNLQKLMVYFWTYMIPQIPMQLPSKGTSFPATRRWCQTQRPWKFRGEAHSIQWLIIIFLPRLLFLGYTRSSDKLQRAYFWVENDDVLFAQNYCVRLWWFALVSRKTTYWLARNPCIK